MNWEEWKDYSPEPLHEETRLDSAADLLARLDVTAPEWTAAGEHTCPWVFRGQDRAGDPLLPSAWRDDEGVRAIFEAVRPTVEAMLDPRDPAWIHDTQLMRGSEALLVREFAGLADGLAKDIPHDLPFPRRFDQPEAKSAVSALARHSGVPGSLLDFTTRPEVAAFWAAESPRLTPDSDDPSANRFAVWALDASLMDKTRLNVFRVKRSQNPYLHAQGGLFVHFQDPASYYRVFSQWPRFDACGPLPKEGIRLFTVPIAEARELRRLLEIRSITRAHLAPTLDNVARTIRARWL